MQIKDALARRLWFRTAENNADPVFALSVLSLAERWADYMEVRLEGGETIAAMALEMLRLVVPGTDVFDPHKPMCDAVVDYLDECWRYGDLLRRWYGASTYRKS